MSSGIYGYGDCCLVPDRICNNQWKGKTMEPQVVFPPTDKTKRYAFVTMHKAASSYVGSIMEKLFSVKGYPNVNLADNSFASGIPEYDFVKKNSSLLDKEGYYYGPFRGGYVVDIPPLYTMPLIVHVRDPRDCMVSLYFSLAFSHRPPGPGEHREKFLERRKRLQEMTVEEFVLDMLPDYNAFNRMKFICENNSDAWISRYEDMVTGFKPWLKKVCRHLDIDPKHPTVKEIIRGANFKSKEDKFSHKRQVTPGDFERKLSDKMQEMLYEHFKEDLSYFDYTKGAFKAKKTFSFLKR